MQPTSRFYEVIEDYREAFSRDRDRVVHSSSFRNLEYKTQVFINSEGDYFRTRLTHSLEVSQIARSIAKNLRLNETLAEVIALSHDLGHTPFGHVGGDELDRLIRESGFNAGFEHNYQSFRVVTKLEKRYKNFNGLNLTFATLEGILKHSYPYKKSFLSEELDEVFKFDYHPSLEAVVVDLADEIAYIAHDIDDGIKAKFITFEDLKESELVLKIFKMVKKEGIKESEEIFRLRFGSHLINHLIFSLLENSSKSSIKTDKILSKTIKANEPLPIAYPKLLKRDILILKKILFQKLYRSDLVVKKMFLGKNCIKGIYKAVMKEEELLPKEFYNRLEFEKKHRVVADFISSLSDRGALKFYNELYIGG